MVLRQFAVQYSGVCLPGVGEVGPECDDVLRDEGLRRGGLEVEGGDFLGERKTEDQRQKSSTVLSLTQIECK